SASPRQTTTPDPPRSFSKAVKAAVVVSGLNHTASDFAFDASQDGSPHRHARLASPPAADWPSSAGRGWLPAGLCSAEGGCLAPLRSAAVSWINLAESDPICEN